MSDEQWKPVTVADGYEVSDLGRVMSFRRGGPRELRGQIGDGYRRVTLQMPNGTSRSTTVHRLVALAFLGPCPEGQEVRHLNGDRQDNTLQNLRFGTRSENTQDSIDHGTHPQASKTHCLSGHEFTPENTRIYRGRRYCRPCHIARNRDYKIRKQFAAANVQTSEIAA